MLFLTYSCKNAEKENKITFFGGKVTNPKEAYVYFSKNDKVIDSAKINQQDRFYFSLDSIETGLYTFKHGIEFQYLYLEPQDSLLIYLNTWDFDESLIFSGKGSKKNNFLINLFLHQEKIEKKFKYYYSLNEEKFSQKIDEERKILMNQYDDLIKIEGEKPSDFFDNLAKAGINYPLYSKKEFYPLRYKDADNKYGNASVSESFYDYRRELNYNDKSLFNYGTYLYYLESLFYNLAYNKEKIDPSKNNFSLNFMVAVNEILVDDNLRNKYMASGFWGSFKDHLTSEQQKESQDYFFKNCTDEKYLSEAKHAVEQCEQLKNGEKFPELIVLNSNDEEINIHTIVKDQKTVIYFWPKNYASSEKLLNKIPTYKEKYPDILFVGIEINKTTDEWKDFIAKNKLPIDTQFKIDKNCEMYSWFDGDMSRTLIVDENGIVKNGFLFFNDSYNLEKNLHLLKKQ